MNNYVLEIFMLHKLPSNKVFNCTNSQILTLFDLRKKKKLMT